MKLSPRMTSIAFVCTAFLAVGLTVRMGDFRIDVPTLLGSAPAGPHLIIERTERDFGTVDAGAVLQATFSLRNAGTERLVINEDTCCGRPAVLETGTLVIPPGGSAEVTLHAETANEYGLLRSAVDLTSSDPRRPRFELALIARIARPLAEARP